MGDLTIRCVGACGGDPSWRGHLGLPCTVCGGAGVVHVYSQSEHDAMEWGMKKRARARYQSVGSRPPLPKQRRRKRRETKLQKAQRARDLDAKVWEKTRREFIAAGKMPTAAEREELRQLREAISCRRR